MESERLSFSPSTMTFDAGSEAPRRSHDAALRIPRSRKTTSMATIGRRAPREWSGVEKTLPKSSTDSFCLSGHRRFSSRDCETKDEQFQCNLHSNSFLVSGDCADSTDSTLQTTTTTTIISNSRLSPDLARESVLSSALSPKRRRSSRLPSSSVSSSSSHLAFFAIIALLFASLSSTRAFPSCSPNPCMHGAECVDSDTQVGSISRMHDTTFVQTFVGWLLKFAGGCCSQWVICVPICVNTLPVHTLGFSQFYDLRWWLSMPSPYRPFIV